MNRIIEVLKGKDLAWCMLVTVILLSIIGFGFYSLTTGKDLRLIEIVLTALLMKFGTLVDYKYGSSRGSREKTELLNKTPNS